MSAEHVHEANMACVSHKTLNELSLLLILPSESPTQFTLAARHHQNEWDCPITQCASNCNYRIHSKHLIYQEEYQHHRFFCTALIHTMKSSSTGTDPHC